MSKPAPFDTLAYAKELEASGIATHQAEAQAAALAKVLEFSVPNKVETDSALTRLENKMDARFAKVDARFVELENKMDARFAELENKIDARFAELENKIDARFGELDKKFDLKHADLDKKIEILRGDMNEKIGNVKNDIIRWIVGTMLIQITLIVSLFKLLH